MPYRASLSGIFGSGVQAPTPRQPLIDVGSVVDAVTGGINAQTQRMTLRHSIAQQDAAQQLAERRQSAYETHQQEMERSASERDRLVAEKEAAVEKANLLKAQAEYGYVPAHPVTVSSGAEMVPGLAGAYNAVAAQHGGAALPSETMPGHVDVTQSLPYQMEQARAAAAQQRTDATVAGGLTRTRAALAGRAAAGGAKEDPVESKHRGFLLTRTKELMKPGEPDGLMKKRPPGLPLATAQQQAESEWQAAHATASGAGSSGGSQQPAQGVLTPQQKADEVLSRVVQGRGTIDQALASPYLSDEVKALVRQKVHPASAP